MIANGIFLQEFDPLPPAGEFRSKHPALVDRPFVLFLSRLHYKKGLDYLANAFAVCAAEIPELQLVVAGPDGGAKDEFVSIINSRGLQDRTFLVGAM